MNQHAGYVRKGSGSFGHVADDYAFIAITEYDPTARRAQLTITLFRSETGQWRRQTFSLVQTCYEPDDLRAAMRAAGFADCTLYDAFDVGIAPVADDRAFVVGRKID